jgi:hypothetical protein
MSTQATTAVATTTAVKTRPAPNLSREEFARNGGTVVVEIGGHKFLAEATTFSTRSLGWKLNGSYLTNVNGVPVKVQVGLNLTIANTKQLPDAVLTEGETVE